MREEERLSHFGMTANNLLAGFHQPFVAVRASGAALVHYRRQQHHPIPCEMAVAIDEDIVLENVPDVLPIGLVGLAEVEVLAAQHRADFAVRVLEPLDVALFLCQFACHGIHDLPMRPPLFIGELHHAHDSRGDGGDGALHTVVIHQFLRQCQAEPGLARASCRFSPRARSYTDSRCKLRSRGTGRYRLRRRHRGDRSR